MVNQESDKDSCPERPLVPSAVEGSGVTEGSYPVERDLSLPTSVRIQNGASMLSWVAAERQYSRTAARG